MNERLRGYPSWTTSAGWQPEAMSTISSRYLRDVHISKMYFGHWKTPGVSERMGSVNLDVSISGEYQTVGGHSGRPSE